MSRGNESYCDPEFYLWAEEAFRPLIQKTLQDAKKAGVIVFHFDRYEEIKASKGLAIAEHLLRQLSQFLSSALRPGDKLGRLGPDNIALLAIENREGTVKGAQRLQSLAAASLRYPVSVGVSHGDNVQGNADIGLWAVQAAQAACRAGSRRIYFADPSGATPLEIKSAAAETLPTASLEARYQRLTLLNRISLELFSDQPFEVGMEAACRIVMSLMGCRYVSLHFCDDLGRAFSAFHYGENFFSLEAESEVVQQALSERRPLTGSSAPAHWRAASFFSAHKPGPSADGVVIVGYPNPQAPNEDSDRTLLEIRRLLANARQLRKNQEQQKVMAAITEQSADAIFMTDLQSRIILWNPSSEKLFHYSREEIIGRDYHSLINPENVKQIKEMEQRASETGTIRFETVGLLKEGAPLAVEADFTPLHGETGATFGMVCVMRDITKRKEVERMKTEFVFLVSHELRTPLTAIQGFSETLMESRDQLEPAKLKQYLGIIFKESLRLGKLVTEFLDISKLESGVMELKRREVDIKSLLERLISLFREHPSKTALKAAIADGSGLVFADEDQLYQVLVNLCGNAIKYSPANGTVTISCRRRDGFSEISVCDEGPGIPKEYQSKLFDRFYRVADPITQKTPGTGLGLAICKGIVGAHGGKIWVESAPQQGTCFKFTLPLSV